MEGIWKGDIVNFLMSLKLKLSKQDFELWSVISWLILRDRNSIFHGGAARLAGSLLEDADYWLREYQRFVGSEKVSASRTMINCDKKWKAPTMGQLKLNVDAAVKCSSDFIGIGVVVRDCNGIVLGASSLKFAGHLSPFLAECVAVREGIKFAINHGLSPGVIETDAQNVVLALQEKTFNALEGPVVRDISRLLERLGNASCRFTCRSCNAAAHSLAQFAFHNNVSQS
ncbi:Ribonuclease H-like domain containing protein [Trema orientale]|uniref:Ribonuclease H-like domain containing protein n=1 Tax=Trema orientale TaxID=63057 RepID=A0A2P5CUQ4_TREOI|nr:Ribonuclease H-like domain containing protein [Trema orientale]